MSNSIQTHVKGIKKKKKKAPREFQKKAPRLKTFFSLFYFLFFYSAYFND